MTLSDFKAKRVLYYKNLGYRTIFIGDSQNDYYAAKNADISFASLRLKEILENEEYPFRNLDNFYSVMETINASSIY
jgi:2-hydroxy-3-keto-5-methylthiopentenyl-1-phosphate phosphatase